MDIFVIIFVIKIIFKKYFFVLHFQISNIILYEYMYINLDKGGLRFFLIIYFLDK